MITIQYQDDSGNWIDAEFSQNFPSSIRYSMNQVKNSRNGARTRAVNADNQVVDIL